MRQRWTDDDAIVLEGCQRLLVSMQRNIESFGERCSARFRSELPSSWLYAVAAKCWRWLTSLDNFRNWLIREAA